MILNNIQMLTALLLTLIVIGLLTVSTVAAQDKNVPDNEKIPKEIMNTLLAKFPKAVIHKWAKEKEGDFIIYDIEFQQDSQKFEADIKEDGSIHNWEMEVDANDVPQLVIKTVEDKYPKYIPKEIMKITAIIDGKDILEGFEIVLETGEKKEVEVTIAPDGEILEDSGDEN
jgi:hypothetical protein